MKKKTDLEKAIIDINNQQAKYRIIKTLMGRKKNVHKKKELPKSTR